MRKVKSDLDILNDEQIKTIIDSMNKGLNMDNNINWTQEDRCLKFY